MSESTEAAHTGGSAATGDHPPGRWGPYGWLAAGLVLLVAVVGIAWLVWGRQAAKTCEYTLAFCSNEVILFFAVLAGIALVLANVVLALLRRSHRVRTWYPVSQAAVAVCGALAITFLATVLWVLAG